MGMVKCDIHKKEREFSPLNLSDENVVKYLILHRDKLDVSYNANINCNIYEAGDIYELNVELICLYADLDNLIKQSQLKEKELLLIKLLFKGNSLADIPYVSNLFLSNVSDIDNAQRSVRNMFDRITKKLIQTNNDNWKRVITKNYLS